jgi:hypothetical protein
MSGGYQLQGVKDKIEAEGEPDATKMSLNWPQDQTAASSHSKCPAQLTWSQQENRCAKSLVRRKFRLNTSNRWGRKPTAA